MQLNVTWDVTAVTTGGMTPDSPFPWGKHKGVPINRVPRDYLVWAVNNADHMRDDLKAVVCLVLGITPPPGEPKQEQDPAAPGLREAWAAATRKVKDQERELKDLRARLAAPTTMKLTDPDRFRVIVKQFFRSMSLIYHPDRGGSVESQAILNACYSDLSRRLEGDEG